MSSQSFAQVLPPQNVRAILKVDTTNTVSLAALMQNPNQSATLSSTKDLEVKVDLVTITDIDKIHVKVGTTSGGNDIAQQIFTLDNAVGLPNSCSYYRDGLVLHLGMGTFNGLTSFYIEVKLEDVNGTFSTPAVYHKN